MRCTILLALHFSRRLTAVNNVRIVAKKKHRIVGNWDLLKEYFRPTYRLEKDFINTFELLRFVAYVLIPLLTLLFWKYSYKDYGSINEELLRPMLRPAREPTAPTSSTSYFNVLDDLELRRDEALLKLGSEAIS